MFNSAGALFQTPYSYGWLNKLRHFLSRQCTCFATAVVFAAIAGLFYFGYQDFIQLSKTRLDTDSDTDKFANEVVHSQAAINFKRVALLFGKMESKKVITLKKPPVTALDLTLTATFTHVKATKSIAFIAVKNHSTKKFRVGDEISAGTVLNSINTGYVIIERNSRKETLYLPILTGNFEQKEASPSPKSSGAPIPSAFPSATATKKTASRIAPSNDIAELHKKKLVERLKLLRSRKKSDKATQK